VRSVRVCVVGVSSHCTVDRCAAQVTHPLGVVGDDVTASKAAASVSAMRAGAAGRTVSDIEPWAHHSAGTTRRRGAARGRCAARTDLFVCLYSHQAAHQDAHWAVVVQATKRRCQWGSLTPVSQQ